MHPNDLSKITKCTLGEYFALQSVAEERTNEVTKTAVGTKRSL
jgi:hypothetical protein